MRHTGAAGSSYAGNSRSGLSMLLLLASLAATAPMAVSQYTVQAIWGASQPNPSSATGSFSAPDAIAIDGSGNVYVSEYYNNRVQQFDLQGNFIKYIGASAPSHSSANGSFDEPWGVAIDGSGNIYVADRFNNRVQKFDSNGNFITFIGHPSQYGSSANGYFSYPSSMAFDGVGNLYVADEANSRIQKFDPQGKFNTSITANGSFASPYGVAIDGSGNIYVADTDNSRVQKLDSQGNFITFIGDTLGTSANGSFKLPFGVATDGSGNIYVADTFNSRVQKFDPQGNFVTDFGASALNKPQGVAVDGSGNIYVADTFNNRVVVYAIPSPPPPSPPPSPPSPSPPTPSPPTPSPPTPSPPTPSPHLHSPSPPSPSPSTTPAASPPPATKTFVVQNNFNIAGQKASCPVWTKEAQSATNAAIIELYNGTGLLVEVWSACVGAALTNSTAGRRLAAIQNIGDVQLDIVTYERVRSLAAAQASADAFQTDLKSGKFAAAVVAGIHSPSAKAMFKPRMPANPKPSCIVGQTCPQKSQQWGVAASIKDFLGKHSQLKAKPGATVLLFSYAGNGMASEELSVRVARWKPRPNRVVTVAANVKLGTASVTLSLDASHRLMATIVSGGKATTLRKGVKKVGSATVAIVPGALSWAARCTIKTPTLTVTAQQEGFLGALTKPAGIMNVKLSALPTLAGPFDGVLATSYQTAVARSKSLSITAGAASVLLASVTNTAA